MGHVGREGKIDPNEKCGHPVPREGKGKRKRREKRKKRKDRKTDRTKKKNGKENIPKMNLKEREKSEKE